MSGRMTKKKGRGGKKATTMATGKKQLSFRFVRAFVVVVATKANKRATETTRGNLIEFIRRSLYFV